MSHFDRAAELLEKLDNPTVAKMLTPAERATAANAHALLSLVEIVEVLVAAQLPPPPEEQPAVPFEQTREGWSWDDGQGSH